MTNFKYILMCGGEYNDRWETPKQLNKIGNETIVERTIRQLRENGITDIAISSNNPIFEQFGVLVLHHENNYGNGGMWVDAFYPTDDPVCYIFGDVVFSPEAIKTIVETDTDDIEFFASAPPFAENYIKPWAEPFAFKVRDQQHLKNAVAKVKEIKDSFRRDPIAWELWQVIKNTPINKIDYTNYTKINDYTCDVDNKRDVVKFNNEVFGMQ